jgi:cholesterol transport system auxiliary component
MWDVKTAKSSWSVWTHRLFLRAAAALGLLGMLASASCGGAIPKTYYYTLQAPAPPPSNDPKTNFVLGVERLRAPEMLRDDRIVYYESPTQINFYQYHRWGADPAALLTEFLAQWLDGMGVFAQVRLLPGREPLDYALRGQVLSFEEVDYEGTTRARVALELTLVRSRDHKVVWSARSQKETPAGEKSVAAVASALSDSSHQLLREMLPGLVAQIEKDYQANSGQQP